VTVNVPLQVFTIVILISTLTIIITFIVIMIEFIYLPVFNMNIVHEYTQKEKKRKENN